MRLLLRGFAIIKRFASIYLVDALFLILTNNFIISQRNDYIWMTGYGQVKDSIISTFGVTKWNFNTPSLNPSFSYDSNCVIEFLWTNNIISFDDGKRLLAYNGFIVTDESHQIITNGTGGFGRVFSDFDNTYQAGLFLPSPISSKVYLLHEFDYLSGQFGTYYSDGFRYSILDISPNSNSAIILKNQLLFKDSLDMARQCAIRHANGRDWWIIRGKYGIKSFYKILFAKDSFYVHDIQTIGSGQYNPFGCVSVSPSGEYIAYFAHELGVESTKGKKSSIINIYKFDRSTGLLFDPKIIQVDTLQAYLFGLAFSPNSKLLYLSRINSIYQIDLLADTLKLDEVGKYDGYYDYLKNGTKANTWFGFIELAPDGRVYGTTSCCTQQHLFYIDKPNLKGTACDLRQHAIKITMQNSLPSFPNYRLGPIDGSPFDTLGIDNIPVPEFRYDQDTLNFLKIEFTNLSWFEPKEFWWDWGDQSNSYYTTQKDTLISHAFPKEGIYQVCLKAKNGNGEKTICKEINLGTTRTKNNDEEIHLEIYPNPATDFCIINLVDYLPNYMTIKFIDLYGNLLLSNRLFQGSNIIDIESLNSGVYIIEIMEKGKTTRTEKFIKM